MSAPRAEVVEAKRQAVASGHAVIISTAGDPASYDEWSGIQRFDTPTAFSARDEFDQSAGALTGKTAPVGGLWVGAGDADDFTVETAGHTVQRAAVSDAAAADLPAIGRLVTTTTPAALTDTGVRADFKWSAIIDANVVDGVVFRFTSSAACGGAYFASTSGRTLVAAFKKVGGTFTRIGVSTGVAPPLVAGAWYTIAAVCAASGQVVVWLYPQGTTPGAPVVVVNDSVFATGGTLASGGVGFFDHHVGAAAATRSADNVGAWASTADAACFAGQSLEIRHDRAERENAGGTTWNKVSSRRGNYLRFAPGAAEGRSNRFFLKGVRGQEVQTNVWTDPSIDPVEVSLFAVPLGVAVPEP